MSPTSEWSVTTVPSEEGSPRTPPPVGAPWYGYERAAGGFSKPAANLYPMGSEDEEEYEGGSDEEGDVGELALDSALEVYLQL
jgi:hypothetical protein